MYCCNFEKWRRQQRVMSGKPHSNASILGWFLCFLWWWKGRRSLSPWLVPDLTFERVSSHFFIFVVVIIDQLCKITLIVVLSCALKLLHRTTTHVCGFITIFYNCIVRLTHFVWFGVITPPCCTCYEAIFIETMEIRIKIVDFFLLWHGYISIEAHSMLDKFGIRDVSKKRVTNIKKVRRN